MNVENVKKLVSYLRALPSHRGFSMAGYIELDENGPEDPLECGAVACIAGHAVLHLGTPDIVRRVLVDDVEHPFSAGRKLLDLSAEEADYMFLGRWSRDGVYADSGSSRYLRDIKLRDAIEYLERCVEAGKVVRA